MRRTLFAVTRGLIVGLLSLATAAGAVALGPLSTGAPVDDPVPALTAEQVLDAAGIASAPTAEAPAAVEPGDEELDSEEIAAVANGAVTAPNAGRLPEGTFLVGASRATLAPAPDQWQTEGCTTYSDEGPGDVNGDHVVPTPEDMRGWPAASPDCIYLGGFGIGPARPAERVGHGGIWVRTIAISNGERTFIYGIADTVGWFSRYDAEECADCGIRDVRERLGADLDIGIEDIAIGSTHTHAGADTYGGWGGIPSWYRSQLRDAAIASAKQAVANLRPATITVGDTQLRNRNNQRREFYYSNADVEATWLQATALPSDKKCKTEPCEPVLATWSTFAGHPTIVGEPILHADWPGAAARRFEATYGGVGLLFEGGLGNVSVSGVGGDDDEAKAESTGIAIADDIARSIGHDGQPLADNTMAAVVDDAFTHPVQTNPGLATLGAVGLFDREFTPGSKGAGLPGSYQWSKEDGPGAARSCSSTGPTVITTVGSHRVGGFHVAFAPGEIFSNIAEVVKEEADTSVATMVMGQTNDALGYIIQSFEQDAASNVVTHYGTKTHEYEEVFNLDRCLGDHVLQTLLDSADQLGL